MHKLWQTMTIEEISEFVSGGGTPSTKVDSYWNGDIQWLTPSDVTTLNGSLYVSSTSRTITEEGLNSSSAKLYNPGTILMTSRATIGKPVINTVPMATNQGFINFLPKTDIADAEFIAYWIKLNESRIAGMGTGSTFKEISKGKFKTVEVAFPELTTQKKIAHILSTIQNKIENIDKQIESYSSLKKSVMEKLFTEGLNNEKLKETEIGMIPESWDIVPISKTQIDLIDGDRSSKYPSGNDVKESGDILFLSTSNIDKEGIILTNLRFITEEKYHELSKGQVLEGDLIITTRGTLGNIGYFKGTNYNRAFINAQMMIIRNNDEHIFTNFLFTQLISSLFQKQIQASRSGSAQQQIPKGVLKNLLLVLPSISEQKQISKQVTFMINKIEIVKKQRMLYQELFNNLLNRLMNQEIEVDNLQFTL